MNEVKEVLKNKDKRLFGLCCFLAGIIIGFCIAPIKQGMSCGNNSGNTYYGVKEEDLEDEI